MEPPIRFPTPPARMIAMCFINLLLCYVDVDEFFHEHFHVLLVPAGNAQEPCGVALAAEDKDAAVLEFVRDVFRGLVLRGDADEAAFRRDVGVAGLVEGLEQAGRIKEAGRSGRGSMDLRKII